MTTKTRFFITIPLLFTTLLPVVANAESQMQMAQQAHRICLEYGATPGTGPFYRCMKSQMRRDQYNQSTSHCTGPGMQLNIGNQCDQSVAIGSPNYWQQIDACKQQLTTRCERQASGEYLHRNNAQRIEIYNHNYNHNYGG